ncbi:MAG: CPBP family intramembrane metalloprotease [Clostridiales bacterium]|nr:CPBP family intramembrane metalloprotease [Clostridiales bacterium]
MKFIEKASGWLIVTGLAIAVLLAFNYLDVFIMVGFRTAGVNTKIYRGAYSITAALVNTILFGLVFLICKKIKRPVLDVKKIGISDLALSALIALGMLGFVITFMYVADWIGDYIKSFSQQMTEYRESVNRYSGVEEDVVPFWDSCVYLFSLCLVVPLEEELIFRGAVFGILKQRMKPLVAALLSAVLFGVMHAVSIHTAYALICGLILCGVYYYTENIFASTLMHALFNFFGSGLLDLLKLKEFGVPAEVRSEIISWTNSICIMLMVPAGLAYLYLRHKTIKRKKLKAESVASVE